MPLHPQARVSHCAANQAANSLPSQAAEEAIERILEAQKVLWRQIAQCDGGRKPGAQLRACMTPQSIARVKAAQSALLQALLAAEWESCPPAV